MESEIPAFFAESIILLYALIVGFLKKSSVSNAVTICQSSDSSCIRLISCKREIIVCESCDFCLTTFKIQFIASFLWFVRASKAIKGRLRFCSSARFFENAIASLTLPALSNAISIQSMGRTNFYTIDVFLLLHSYSALQGVCLQRWTIQMPGVIH